MQTKHQIQQLLTSAGLKPNKRLGQHFLIDLNLMRLLVDSADIRNDDIVLEVGCGTGSLTEVLVQKAGRVIAVEYDHNLAEIAKIQLSNADNLEIFNADILKNKNTINNTITNIIKSAKELFTGRFMLVSNLPYNVASAVMMNFITGPTVSDCMYVTVQKEVANRMTATPGTHDYGKLSILLQAAGEIRKIRTLKPTVFWPQPQVDSAMVGFIRNNEKTARIKNIELFEKIVDLFMGHRRKTLSATGKLEHDKFPTCIDWPVIFQKSHINPAKRPENLTYEEYITLSNSVK